MGGSVAEVPEGYAPSEAEAPPPVTTGPLGPEIVRREASAQELRQVEQDPVVRQTLELFDGILIHVERQAPAKVPPATE